MFSFCMQYFSVMSFHSTKRSVTKTCILYDCSLIGGNTRAQNITIYLFMFIFQQRLCPHISCVCLECFESIKITISKSTQSLDSHSLFL